MAGGLLHRHADSNFGVIHFYTKAARPAAAILAHGIGAVERPAARAIEKRAGVSPIRKIVCETLSSAGRSREWNAQGTGLRRAAARLRE